METSLPRSLDGLGSSGYFVHPSLDPATNEFRLLKIARTISDSSETEYELEVFSYETNHIKSVPQYVALSYVWGPELPNHTITVNAKPYSIRENLYHFLQEYATQKEHQYIWIDQICINQASPTERNHQVSLMSRIYSRASVVIIWLGQEDSKTRLGLEIFRELQTPMYCDLHAYLHLPSEVKPGKANIAKWVLNNGEPKLKQEVIESINHIYSNPFWTRLWIVQEVLLGRHVVVQQGKMVFHLGVIGMLERKGLCPLDGRMMDPPEVALLSRQDGPAWSRRRDLRWMISEFCDFGCEDPRDKVYGILGVVEYGYVVPIDYRKSAEEVFVDTVFATMSYLKALTDEKYEYAEEEAKSTATALYRLARNMIPENVSEFYEEEDNNRIRFRKENLEKYVQAV